MSEVHVFACSHAYLVCTDPTDFYMDIIDPLTIFSYDVPQRYLPCYCPVFLCLRRSGLSKEEGCVKRIDEDLASGYKRRLAMLEDIHRRLMNEYIGLMNDPRTPRDPRVWDALRSKFDKHYTRFIQKVDVGGLQLDEVKLRGLQRIGFLLRDARTSVDERRRHFEVRARVLGVQHMLHNANHVLQYTFVAFVEYAQRLNKEVLEKELLPYGPDANGAEYARRRDYLAQKIAEEEERGGKLCDCEYCMRGSLHPMEAEEMGMRPVMAPIKRERRKAPVDKDRARNPNVQIRPGRLTEKLSQLPELETEKIKQAMVKVEGS